MTSYFTSIYELKLLDDLKPRLSKITSKDALLAATKNLDDWRGEKKE